MKNCVALFLFFAMLICSTSVSASEFEESVFNLAVEMKQLSKQANELSKKDVLEKIVALQKNVDLILDSASNAEKCPKTTEFQKLSILNSDLYNMLREVTSREERQKYAYEYSRLWKKIDSVKAKCRNTRS